MAATTTPPCTAVASMLVMLLLLSGPVTAQTGFDQDFVHSFLQRPEKLESSARLTEQTSSSSSWLQQTGYQNAVGIVVENWTNQRLEFPEVEVEAGGQDRWYQPAAVPPHTRDLALLAHSTRGDHAQGCVCWLVEDSWPRLYLCLAWRAGKGVVRAAAALTDSRQQYTSLAQQGTTLMKDKMRMYKGTTHYVVVVSSASTGSATQLTLAVLPQNLDVWAWEKYYRAAGPAAPAGAATLQRVELGGGTEAAATTEWSEEADTRPAIFSRKELLSAGESLARAGNRTARQVMGGLGGSVACGVRVENWSRYRLSAPRLASGATGRPASSWPLRPVLPGQAELAVLEQNSALTGVAAVLRWDVGATGTVLSLMLSVPYSQHLYSVWIAAGLTDASMAQPDFTAMYSGTPDSAWFVRGGAGQRLEFTDGEIVLVAEVDPGTSRPVIHLSVVPLDPNQVAGGVAARLAGRAAPAVPGREGDRSMLALSSAAQCHCPCLAAGWSRLRLTWLAVLLGLLLHSPLSPAANMHF